MQVIVLRCRGSLIILAVMLLALQSALAAGVEVKKPLALIGISRWNANPAWSGAADQTLALLSKEAAGRYVGREITVTWEEFPPDTSYLQFLQKRAASGTMPHLLRVEDLHYDAEGFAYARAQGLLYAFTQDTFTRNMPAYIAALKSLETSFKDLWDSNKASDGALWYIPVELSPGAFPLGKVGADFGARDTFALSDLILRDDVLKKIFPAARTESELKALALLQGGLSLSDMVADLPIHSFADLYRYFTQVKALNLKVGDKPLIPGAIIWSSEDPTSLDYSLTSAMGYGYKAGYIWQDPPAKSFFFHTSSLFREQARWFNRMYVEGLLDPEIFSMSNRQYHERMISGQYAAISGWMSGRLGELREVADARGYGFRILPLFYPMDMTSAHNKWMPQSLQKQGFFLTTAIRKEDLADVMKWCDFFFTEQSDELAYWGSPGWYTGKGAERRYAPEFKDLENYLLYGTRGGHDGAFYGIGGGALAAPAIETPRSQLDVKPLSFFPPRYGYPLAPYWVYPRDPLQSMKGVDLLTYCQDRINELAVSGKQTFFRSVGFNIFGDLWGLPEDATVYQKLNPDSRSLLAKALTAPTDQFDGLMDRYLQLWKDAGIDALEAAARAYMAKTLPRIVANAIKD